MTPSGPYGNWGADAGVTHANGTALTRITSGTPAIGQYLAPADSAGTCTFAAADANASVLISYSYIPADIEDVEVVVDYSALYGRNLPRQSGRAGTGRLPYAIMHDKFIVVDGVTVEEGSFNYTAVAENVVVLHDPGLAAQYARESERPW